MTRNCTAYHTDKSKLRAGQIYTRETALEWRAMLKNPGNGKRPPSMKQLEIDLGLPRNTIQAVLERYGV